VSEHEHEYEPVPGLPERLPAGERMLWQGAPDWQALARRALHVRKVALYFGLLSVWHVVDVSRDGVTFAAALQGAAWLLLVGAAGIGVLGLLAWALARSTIYTITSSRIVLRFGVALPMTVNLPFRVIDGSGIVRHDDGSADVPVTLASGQRVSYFMTWPHVRPWRFFAVQPTLRSLRDGERAASILAEALAAAEPSAAQTGAARAPREASPTPSRAAVTAAA
jgi:hypothetical protein